MIKNFTSFLIASIAVFTFNALNAQDLELVPSDTVYKMDTVADKFDRVDFTGYVKNNTANNVTINWEVVLITGPSTWAYYYCDAADCLDLGDFSSGSYVLNAGDSAIGKAQIGNDNPSVPFWEAGYGEVHMRVWMPADSANTAVVGVYKADIVVDSSNFNPPSAISPVELKNINLYPNPATGYVQIDIPAELHNGTIRVYNIIGDLVLDQPASAVRNGALTIDYLNRGIYFAKVVDETGMVVKTLKFSKK